MRLPRPGARKQRSTPLPVSAAQAPRDRPHEGLVDRAAPDRTASVTLGVVVAASAPLEQVVAKSDLLILSTPHRAYRTANLGGKPIVDVWGILDNANVIR